MNPKGRMNEWKRVDVCGQQQITDYTSFIHNFFLPFFVEREREEEEEEEKREMYEERERERSRKGN